MRILITGGLGFIGHHLTAALLARGEDTVVLLDNLYRPPQSRLPDADDRRLLVIHGDIRNPGDVQRAIERVDLVFHLAAQANVLGSIADPLYSVETNVLGTFNVLAAAREAHVARVVFASSREVYGEQSTLPVAESAASNAKNIYGVTKVAGEAYCRTFSTLSTTNVAVLRLGNVYGPYDAGRVIPHWIALAAKNQPLEIYGGDQVVDFVPVATVVDAMLRAASAQNLDGPVNIASGRGTSLQTLAQAIVERLSSRSPITVVPSREKEVRKFVANLDRMRSLLGVEPPSDPLVGLQATIEAYRAVGGKA